MAQIDYQSLGQSGLKGYDSGFLYEEFLPELRGPRGYKQYREMAENDPVCHAILFAIGRVIKSVKWRVEPVDETEQADEAKEFVEQVLFEDMDHSFNAVLDDALTMLPHGFAPLEIVYKIRQGPVEGWTPAEGETVEAWVRRMQAAPPAPSSKFDDKQIGIHKLSLRSQDTVWRWHFDQCGDWLAFEQELVRGYAVLPRHKILLFRTTEAKNNPEGKSLLRAAFVPWTRKKLLEIAEGRLNVRAGGIGVFSVPAEIMSDDADEDQRALFARLQEYAAKFSRDQQGAMLLPSDRDDSGNLLFDFQIKNPGSQSATDIGSSIERYDRRIAAAVLADFLLMGGDKTGSYALSAEKTDIFALSLEAIINAIAETLNRELLPRLWEINGYDPALMPALKPGAIRRRDIEKLAGFLQKLTQAGATLFPNLELTNTVLAEADLPEMSEEMAEELMPAPREEDDMAMEDDVAAEAAGSGVDKGVLRSLWRKWRGRRRGMRR